MQSSRFGAWIRGGVLALSVVCAVWAAELAPAASRGAESAEIRALWVTRSSLATPASIATLVRSAHDHGFNTLLVQVRGRADAYYASDLEPRAAELGRQPRTFDP